MVQLGGGFYISCQEICQFHFDFHFQSYLVFYFSISHYSHGTRDTREIPSSASGVSAIRKDGLACDPLAVGAEEPDDRCNVLNHGQAVVHSLRLVKFDSLRRLLRVEEC